MVKITMILLSVMAVFFFGYDVWYLFEGQSDGRVPFLFSGVLSFFFFCLKVMNDLPPAM